VLIEPIQGEGGVQIPPPGYLKEVREFCNQKGLLLIVDEIQTGIGRTGRLFGYEHEGIEPDIMTLAKALASGFPIGAMVAKDEVASAFEPGDHASTFGGNPLATTVGVATLETLLQEELVRRAQEMGDYLLNQLVGLKKWCSAIKEVR